MNPNMNSNASVDDDREDSISVDNTPVDSIEANSTPVVTPYAHPPSCPKPPHARVLQYDPDEFTDKRPLSVSPRGKCTVSGLAETLIEWMAHGTSNSKNLNSIIFWKTANGQPKESLLSFSVGDGIDTIQIVRVDIPRPYPTPLAEPWIFICTTGYEVSSVLLLPEERGLITQ
jgi:hypothetical protein